MIRRLFNNNRKQSSEVYLAAYNVPTENIEFFDQFVRSQMIEKDSAFQLDSFVKLKFGVDGKLNDLIVRSFGEEENTSDLKKTLTKNKILNVYVKPITSPNTYYEFYIDDLGLHNIGGDTPLDFIIPENKCPNSFQQVAFINRQDKAFNWLPFDLNIICPIYLGFDKLWLDYSNPMKPWIINQEEIDEAYSDGILKINSSVKFEQKSFSTKAHSVELFGVGFTGAPNSAQGECAPRCIRTQNVMRLVGQFNSSNGVKCTSFELAKGFEKYADHFKEMTFAGDSSLFVYFEPSSKLMCLYISS